MGTLVMHAFLHSSILPTMSDCTGKGTLDALHSSSTVHAHSPETKSSFDHGSVCGEVSHSSSIATTTNNNATQALSAARTVPRSGTSGPAAVTSRADNVKERNRLAQMRYRARKKAEERAQQEKWADMQRQLVAGKASIFEHKRRGAALRERITKLDAQLAAVADDFARPSDAGPLHPLSLEPRNPTGLPPGLLPRFAPQRAAAAAHTDTCRIFRRHEQHVPKHTALISSRIISQQGNLFTNLTAFQAESARRMGCREADVVWLLENVRHPVITRDAAVTSNLSTGACRTKCALVWVTCQIETAVLLANLLRLEKLRDEHPFSQRLRDEPFALPPHFVERLPANSSNASHCTASNWPSTCSDAAMDGPPRPGGAQPPPPAGTPAAATHAADADNWEKQASNNLDAGAADGVDELTEHLYSFLLHDAFPTAQPRGFDCMRIRTLGDCAKVMRHVLSTILNEHLPKMHPADVLLLCRRVLRSYGNQAGGTEDESCPEPLTPGTGYSTIMSIVVSTFRAIAQEARANPSAAHLPTSREAIERAIQATEQQIAAVYFEWTLSFTFTCRFSPRWVYGSSAGLNPAAIGFAKFEEKNLQMYKMLAFTTEQKQALVHVWSGYRSKRRRIAQARIDCAEQLASLPSPALLPGDLEPSLRRNLEQPIAGCIGASQTRSAPVNAFPWATPTSVDSAVPTTQLPRMTHLRSNLVHVGSSEPRVTHSGTLPAASAAGGTGSDWTRSLLGVSVEATERAERLLLALQALVAEENDAHLEFLCRFKYIMTPKQQAIWFTGTMPFVADSHRIAVMAATDLACDRSYGRVLCDVGSIDRAR